MMPSFVWFFRVLRSRKSGYTAAISPIRNGQNSIWYSSSVRPSRCTSLLSVAVPAHFICRRTRSIFAAVFSVIPEVLLHWKQKSFDLMGLL